MENGEKGTIIWVIYFPQRNKRFFKTIDIIITIWYNKIYFIFQKEKSL